MANAASRMIHQLSNSPPPTGPAPLSLIQTPTNHQPAHRGGAALKCALKRNGQANPQSWIARKFRLMLLDPVLPLSPGRAERHGFEYYRLGTQSLDAALHVKTGQVAGKTAKRHPSADFIAFLTELIGANRQDQVGARNPRRARAARLSLNGCVGQKTIEPGFGDIRRFGDPRTSGVGEEGDEFLPGPKLVG